KVWKTTKIPLVDAYSRQVHYLVLQKALNTRSKLSNFVPGMSEFCKLCPGEREDLAHVLIECERARSAWEIIDPLWTRVMGIALSSENKFFGGLVVLGKQEYWFLNMIIQVMQCAIWESRRCYENKGIILDLKLYFKRKVNVILNRALLFGATIIWII
ncbi:MAG: zinc-binding domain-containing protein, partial [PVC group bacterium]|nr:zinc-binding domain-containing protein [PVC group bacterium]